MSRMATRFFVLSALVLATAASAAAQPAGGSPAASATPAADIVGTWEMMFNSEQGPVPAEMILKKSPDGYVGSISSDMGSAELEAAVKEKAFTVGFAMTMANGGGTLNVTMNGTVDGDAMKGTFDLGQGPAGDFTGKRAAGDAAQAGDKPAGAAVDVSGTWSVQITTDTVSASPTITLKQDGTKLTGSYVSEQYGEFPLTGTLTGDKIDLAFTMTIEGNALNVAFSGTATKDGLKGNVNYGDMAQGTFAATRKK